MDIFSTITLSILQGISEFLPISSSGHLIIFSNFLNINLDSADLNSFIIFLHFGTLLSVVVYFRKLIFKTAKGAFKNNTNSINLLNNILITSVPICIFGAIFSIYIEPLLTRKTQFLIASISLIVVGTIFFFSEKLKNKQQITIYNLEIKNAFIIGLFQSLGLIYGVSRSGTTILGARTTGLTNKASLDYAFFTSIPIILIANIYELVSNTALELNITLTIIGVIISFCTGYISISFLINFLKSRSLKFFGIYCFLFGFLSLTIYIFK